MRGDRDCAGGSKRPQAGFERDGIARAAQGPPLCVDRDGRGVGGARGAGEAAGMPANAIGYRVRGLRRCVAGGLDRGDRSGSALVAVSGARHRATMRAP